MAKRFSELDEILVMDPDDIVAIRRDSDGKSYRIKKSNMGVGVGVGNVAASANIADTAVVVGDGGVKNVKETGVLIDASDNVVIPVSAALDLIESPAAPATVAGRARVYSKDVGGITTPFAMKGDGTEVDLSAGQTPDFVIALYDLITLLPIDIEITDSGGNIVCTLTDDAGALFVTARFAGSSYTIVTPATVNLTPGTATVPIRNYVFLTEAAGVLTLGQNTTGWPADSVHLAVVFVQSVTEVIAHGPLGLHIYNDDPTEHIQHTGERIRIQNAEWKSGVDPSITISGASPENVHISTLAGKAFQFHEHDVPAWDSATGTDLYVMNDFTTPWTKVTNLNVLLTDSLGVSMADRRFSLTFMAIVNQDTGESKLAVCLPSGSYNSDIAVQQDANKYANFSIPSGLKGNAILVAEAKLRHQTSGGGNWTLVELVDLRGLQPSIVAGGGGAQGTEFATGVFRLNDTTDSTKQTDFDNSAITTGNKRTVTLPDKDVTLATATQTSEGLSPEIATQAEADTGTDPARVMTPDTLRGLAPLAPITFVGTAYTISDAAIADGVHGRTFICNPTTTPTTVTATVGTAAIGSACLVHMGGNDTVLDFVGDTGITVDAGITYDEAMSVRGAFVLLYWLTATYVAVGGERDLP